MHTARIGAYKRIAFAVMMFCSVAVVLMALVSPLDIFRHTVFQEYIGMVAFNGAAALLAMWARARFLDKMETTLGKVVLTWVPDILQLLTFLFWLPGAITMADYLVMPWSLPLADAWLAAPEQAIGLTHPVSYAWFESMGAVPAFETIYGIIDTEVKLAGAYCIFVQRDTHRLWQYTASIGAAGVAAVAALWAIPARGPVFFYEGQYPDMPPMLGYAKVLDALRAGEMYDYESVAGLLSCPSFHTVFALMLTRVWLDAPKPIFWTAAFVNGLVVLSTIPVGSHYLVDIVGGILWTAMFAYGIDRLADRMAASDAG